MAEPKPKILIVEDDLDVAEMLNAYFRVQGYEVCTVNWGEDGVRACQTVRPDLVILDADLAGLRIPEVCHVMKDRSPVQPLKILLITAASQPPAAATESGADDCLCQPVSRPDLQRKVRCLLNGCT